MKQLLQLKIILSHFKNLKKQIVLYKYEIYLIVQQGKDFK